MPEEDDDRAARDAATLAAARARIAALAGLPLASDDLQRRILNELGHDDRPPPDPQAKPE